MGKLAVAVGTYGISVRNLQSPAHRNFPLPVWQVRENGFTKCIKIHLAAMCVYNFAEVMYLFNIGLMQCFERDSVEQPLAK